MSFEKSMSRVRQGDLYEVLKLSKNEDLAGLVAIINTAISAPIALQEEAKLSKPDYKKYTKLIGDEIRLFGGHSVMNLMRQEGPPYSEIVDDVCKQLKVPYIQGGVVGNEANLLDIYMEDLWKSLPEVDREKAVEDARVAAAGEVGANSAAALVGMGIVRVATGPMLALGAGLWTALDANSKITVPSVINVAYLRRKLIREWDQQELELKKRLQNQSIDDSVDQDWLLRVEGEGRSLSFGLISDQEVSQLRWQNPRKFGDDIDRLSPALATVPTLGVASELATGKYMKVVCSGALTKAADGNGFRAMVHGANGVKEHARLFEPAALTNMVNVAALYNVASFALAQKHLADISAKLDVIKKDIEEVAAFQRDQRLSRLTSAIRYFNQIAPSVLDGERHDRFQLQIENYETSLLEIEDHIRININSSLNDMANLQNESWFGTDKFESDITSSALGICQLIDQMLLCIRARFLGWQILCLFPGDEAGKIRRKDDIKKTMDEFSKDGYFFRQYRSKILQSLKKASVSNANSNEILRVIELVIDDSLEIRQSICEDLWAAEIMLADMEKPVTMMLEVEDGQVLRLALQN